MNKKNIITTLLAIVSMAAFAQQVMLADSITKNPVSFVLFLIQNSQKHLKKFAKMLIILE